MPRDFKITAPVLQAVNEALKDGDCWVVFNCRYQVLDVEDMEFCYSQNEAAFACDVRTNAIDLYEMQHIDSVEDFINKLIQPVEVPDLISAEVWEKARKAFENHEHWVAYNNTLLFVHTDDIQFFTNIEDAADHAHRETGEFDDFDVIRIDSLDDFKQKVESIMPGLKYVPPKKEESQELHEDGPGYFPKKLLNENKKIIMKEENLDYLKTQLEFLGFKDGLAKQLEDKMKEGKPEFSLNASTMFGKDQMEAVIHFRHTSKEGEDRYFCNSYIATLKGEDKDRSQFIYVNSKGQNITFKEACNLLHGRSVFKELTPKEGTPYKAWVKIDHENIDQKTGYPKLRQFGTNYGFDLKEAVGRLPFKELSYPDQLQTLMKSLRKGNAPGVTLLKNGGEVKVTIEANPQFKTINMYDSNGEKMYVPNEKVAEKYGKAPIDEKKDKLAESVVSETALKYGKKDLLGKRNTSNGLIEKKNAPRKAARKKAIS